MNTFDQGSQSSLCHNIEFQVKQFGKGRAGGGGSKHDSKQGEGSGVNMGQAEEWGLVSEPHELLTPATSLTTTNQPHQPPHPPIKCLASG